ncbi:MAG TPA: PAS domain-containing protein [Stellaceae bacterium]|nr:PAS domain-containing protein [Stellaceae bacterium]
MPPSDDPITRPPPGANARIVALYDYWRRIAPGAGLLPGRQHLDPADIPRLLPNVWLLDVVGTPPRFRTRLIGTALQRAGIPLRPGVFIDDPVPPALREAMLSRLREIPASRQPQWRRGRPYLPHATEVFEIERIYLPLAADGSAVDMLLCLSVLYESTGKEW